MKRTLFCLFLSSLFFLGTTNAMHIDGGVVVDVHDMKTGEAVFSFSVPDQYLTKDDGLVVPLVITLDNGKVSTTFESDDLQIGLPTGLEGIYRITISIGEFSETKKLHL